MTCRVAAGEDDTRSRRCDRAPPPETYIASYDELCARLATLPPSSPIAERAAAQARAADRRTDSVRFCARRAKVELQRGQPRSAHDAAMAGVRLAAADLQTGAVLDWLMGILEEAWFALGDVELAQRAVAELAHAHGQQPSFLILRAIVERHSGDSAAAPRDLDTVLAADPHHQRAASLRADWHARPG